MRRLRHTLPWPGWRSPPYGPRSADIGQFSLTCFQRHLKAQGKRPNTIDRYATIVGRFLREVGVPDEAVTVQHAYSWLVERGNASGVSSAWYHVIFYAVVAYLTMRGLPTELQGL